MTPNKDDPQQGIYLYCLASAKQPPTVEGSGVDACGALFVECFEGIAAVLSKVALEDFSGAEAEAKLKDIAWVGPHACRHEAVIEGVMEQCSLLPARFGTIFSSLSSLQKLLKKHHGTIAGFLDQVKGKTEWSVKGLMDSAQAKAELFSQKRAQEQKQLAALSPGARYLMEKRIKVNVDKSLQGWLQESLTVIASELDYHADDFSQRKLLSRDATGNNQDMVLNWAYLVTHTAAPDFQRQVRQLNETYQSQGLNLEISGPWPPYSFCPSLGGHP